MAINSPILLPALQANFGNWEYYSVIMSLSEVKKRISFAREIHKNNRLSELIQRQLQDCGSGRANRTSQIAEYIISNEARFFNSIVVGIYGGNPLWHPFKVEPYTEFSNQKLVYLKAEDKVGFLELQGNERMFAIDGQHRVAGIKKALDTDEIINKDSLTVLFVSHKNSEEGIKRTRRLFVDLNKHSIPVGNKDIIILDEVDLAAIIARQLVDEHKWFSKGQVDIERFTDAIPRNSSSLFTIATLFKIIKILLPYVLATNNLEREEVKKANTIRLSEERINYYYNRVIVYFDGLKKFNNELNNFFEQGSKNGIAEFERSPEVCNVLFRPIGQIIFAKIIADLARKVDFEYALRTAKSIPTDMRNPPYVNVIWDPEQNKMISKGHLLATKLLKYMCGIDSNKDSLLEDYRMVLRDDNAKLPKQLSLN